MATQPLPRPEPGTRAGAVAGLIITLGGLARALGWLTDDLDVNAVATQASNLILGAGVLWATLAPLVLAMWARGKVTPLADPRDRDGNALVVDGWLDDDVVTTNPADLVPADPRDPYLDDEPGQHAAPEPTPIAAEVAAALTDTQPAMLAIRS